MIGPARDRYCSVTESVVPPGLKDHESEDYDQMDAEWPASAHKE